MDRIIELLFIVDFLSEDEEDDEDEDEELLMLFNRLIILVAELIELKSCSWPDWSVGKLRKTHG